YPLVWRKERRLHEDNAADLRRTACAAELVPLAKIAKSGLEVVQARGAIPFAEALPSKPLGQTGEARDVPKATDGIARSFQFEEERHAWCSVEGVIVRGTPKVHLLAPRLTRKEVEPVTVRDGYPAFHGFGEVPRKSIRQHARRSNGFGR